MASDADNLSEPLQNSAGRPEHSSRADGMGAACQYLWEQDCAPENTDDWPLDSWGHGFRWPSGRDMVVTAAVVGLIVAACVVAVRMLAAHYGVK